MPGRKTIYISIAVFSAFLVAATAGALLSFLPKFYRLQNFGIKTEGTVISKEQDNHRFITAEYEIENRKFKRIGHAEDFGKSFYAVSLNDKIPVFYNLEDPEESCLGNPDQQLRASLLGTVFVAAFPIIFLVIYLLKRVGKVVEQ